MKDLSQGQDNIQVEELEEDGVVKDPILHMPWLTKIPAKPILVRKEYIRLFNALQSQHKEPDSDAAIVTGQPGIGLHHSPYHLQAIIERF